MQKSKKKKSITNLLTNRLLIYTVIINTVSIIFVLNNVGSLVRTLEAEHLNEIVNNIESNVSATVEKHVQILEIVATNSNFVDLLIASDKENPMHLNQNKDVVLNEMQSIASKFDGLVVNFGLLDIEQDGYFDKDGEFTGDDFSFKDRDYYSVVTDEKTMVTSPYTDYLTGLLVLGIATPIFDYDGDVLGVILIDLSIDFLNQLIVSTEYRETGSSLVLDGNDVILAYNDSNYIGQHVSVLQFEQGSDIIVAEFSKPNNQLIEYTLNDTKKIGVIDFMDEYEWKIFTFMEYSEFHAYTVRILSLVIVIQLISILITVLVASVTVDISLKPISYIRKAMKELAAGNNEYDLRYTSNNEIGDLADDVRFASQNVSNYINKIQTQLDYDELTLLFTEQKFIKETKIILEYDTDEKYSILSFDIDNFKYINDTYGYLVGSEFLKAISMYFILLMGDSTIITRVNGDNFLFLLNERLVETLLNSNNKYFDELSQKAKGIIDESYDLSLSCGLYEINDNSIDVSSMMDCANYAKNKGKSIIGFSIKYYNDKMQEERQSNNYVVSKMRDGTKNKEFIVYYQPKIDLLTDKVKGAEALVRWNNNGELIPPNKFIPVFETNGFIETLDYYIIDTTCEFIKQNTTKEMPLISINLSGVTIMKHDVISKVLSIIEKHNLSPSQIELEITESAFVNNFEEATEKINQFKALGFGISMDDFGCGESSLGRLKDIPIDVIKIDREFIVDSFKNDKVDLILRNIINMAKDLGLKTVVEGIETLDQKKLITELGCDLGQGYIFARPLPPQEFLNLLPYSSL